jgi:hypothetical protein
MIRAWRYGVEDGLHVGGRAADHPQDLGGRRLLLKRLGQVAVPRLELVEQPDILDSDHRLIGEGGDQLNLLVGERPYLGPPDADCPDSLGSAEQRNVEHGPETLGPREPALSGYSSISACMSATWIVRRSSTARPVAVPRRGKAPTGLEGIGPSCATRRSPSPSTWKIVTSKASHRRAALVDTAANTGWTSVGEQEITRRISAVAVCCSSASLRALVISAYDGAGGPLGVAVVSGVPHSPQNFTVGAFPCRQRGHFILEPSTA